MCDIRFDQFTREHREEDRLPSAYKFEISNDEHDEHDGWMALLPSLTKSRKFVVNTDAGKIIGQGENREKSISLWKKQIL